MNDPKNPYDIAREALKRLAARQLPPTPANFQACYNEIAKLPNIMPFPEAPLRELAAELVGRNAAQEEELDRLSAAIGRRSWQGLRESLTAFCNAAPAAEIVPAVVVPARNLPPEFAGRLARFIESVVPALGEDNSRLSGSLGELIAALKGPVPDLAAVEELLALLARQATFAAEEQVEIRGSLLKLLHLIIKNIGELVVDDSWLKGQVDGLLASVEPPLTLRHLDEMERRLRDVIEKQGHARARTVAAQEELRGMLTTFIAQLASMNAVSGDFQQSIEASARQIEAVERIEDIRPLLDQVVSATQVMVAETARSREHLQALEDKVLATEAELVELHLELDHASQLARHDPLTDALNRKGLDEALAREISGMRRKETPLCLSMLDIDNFKKLNDRLGHDAGDGALVHLAEVTRQNIRPTDTLARYGGEEFVILMPEARLDEAVEAMVRLQRELTRAIFMAGDEHVLITFSAGVAQVEAGDDGSEALKRADQAMYLAKRAGKNRVMGG